MFARTTTKLFAWFFATTTTIKRASCYVNNNVSRHQFHYHLPNNNHLQRASSSIDRIGLYPIRSKNTVIYSRSGLSLAKPKRGSIVDTYQTVSVNCNKCSTRLFRYKKKNGTKSNLIKCYIERIAEDSANVLQDQYYNNNTNNNNENTSIDEYICPNCQTRFARSATIKGLPAMKLVGGKVRMTKK